MKNALKIYLTFFGGAFLGGVLSYLTVYAYSWQYWAVIMPIAVLLAVVTE